LELRPTEERESRTSNRTRIAHSARIDLLVSRGPTLFRTEGIGSGHARLWIYMHDSALEVQLLITMYAFASWCTQLPVCIVIWLPVRRLFSEPNINTSYTHTYMHTELSSIFLRLWNRTQLRMVEFWRWSMCGM